MSHPASVAGGASRGSTYPWDVGIGLVETLGRLSAIGGLGDHPAIGIAFAPDVVEPEHLLLALNRPLVWTVTCSRQPLANPPVGDEVAAAGAWYDPVILGS